MKIIGIDPGVTTGFAVWNAASMALERVDSGSILTAMAWCIVMQPEQPLVIFEDCRNHRVSHGRHAGNPAVLQGVGSVKRDCGIWEEFLQSAGMPYLTRSPRASRTKIPAERFQFLTGWTGKSNNHGRDAAMLVVVVNLTMAKSMRDQAIAKQECA